MGGQWLVYLISILFRITLFGQQDPLAGCSELLDWKDGSGLCVDTYWSSRVRYFQCFFVFFSFSFFFPFFFLPFFFLVFSLSKPGTQVYMVSCFTVSVSTYINKVH